MKTLITIYIIFQSILSFAQVPLCGTPSPVGSLPQLSISLPNINLDTVVYRIPIVFTVIGDNQDQADMSEAFLDGQLKTLNEDFRARNADISTLLPQFPRVDCKIEFVKHMTTRRIINAGNDFTSANQFGMYRSSTGGIEIVDSVLNVYYCNIDFAGGFAVFPRPGSVHAYYDACVVRIRSAFGTGRRIASHEVGHWLDLRHTFDSGCNFPGDECDDTPAIPSSSGGCPLTRKGCDNVTTAFVQNYMDYSSCLVAFSNCQRGRMRNVLQPGGIRHYLIGEAVNTPPICDIIRPSKDTTIAVGASLTITVNATDNDGISRVELYLNEAKIYTFLNKPYQLGLSRLQAGTLRVSAKAYDNTGLFTTDMVTVTIGQVSSPIIDIQLTQQNELIFKAQDGRTRKIP